MSFIPKPNTGTIWPNERKAAPNQPDMRGDLFFDKAFLKEMLAKAQEETVKIQISGWNKVIAGKNCLSVSLSAPYVKPQPTPASDEDVPF